MVYFNIIEGSSSDEFYPLYEKIKKDIQNGLMPRDCKKKYNISRSQWRKFQKELVRDKIRPSRKEMLENAKYYTYDRQTKRWVVARVINYRYINFCTCLSEKQAQYVVEELKKCNWDRRRVKRILKKMSQEGL